MSESVSLPEKFLFVDTHKIGYQKWLSASQTEFDRNNVSMSCHMALDYNKTAQHQREKQKCVFK